MPRPSTWITLEASLRRAWGVLPGVTGVRISRNFQGRGPTVVVVTRGAAPRGIPSHLKAVVGLQRWTIPVVWMSQPAPPPVIRPSHKDNLPLHRSMWDGATPTPDRFLPEYPPMEHRPPIAVGELPPVPTSQEMQVMLPVRDPQLPFWSRPFDYSYCFCFNRLATTLPVISFAVPSLQMVTLTGISYSVAGANVGDRFQFGVLKSGGTQAQWQDQVMSLSNGDANQFAFAGHLSPLPLNIIIDHDQQVVVNARALGGAPYTPDDSTLVDVQVCILLHGIITTLNDNRDGAPKTFDIGDLDDVAEGTQDPLKNFNDPALAAAVQQMVNSTADNDGVPP